MIRRLLTATQLLQRLKPDRSGTTTLEFAFVGPVLFLMIFGIFDMAHTQYTSSVLHGAVQKAGRDLTLENATSRQVSVDARVRDQIASVMPAGATVTFEKLSHFDFADVKEPEPYTDQNGDGTCNNNEPYEEINEVAGWQNDRGKDGLGGARDAVLYTAVVTYPRLFPIHKLVELFGVNGMSPNVALEASTVLRNQPFDEQNARTNTPGNCP